MSESEEAGLMAEGKYGRLFTEADVGMIVHAALVADEAHRARRAPGDVTSLSIGDLCREGIAFLDQVPGRATFPADEPLFLLRGQDTCAIPTIAAYQWQIEDEDAPVTHRAAVEIARCEFVRWQHENPDRVKVPD